MYELFVTLHLLYVCFLPDQKSESSEAEEEEEEDCGKPLLKIFNYLLFIVR